MKYENISFKVIIRKIKIKTIRTYCHYISTTMAKSQKTYTTKSWKGYGAIGTLI